MKFRIDKKYFYWGATAFIVIAAGICFYYLLFHGANISSGFHNFARITMPILDGFLLAYLLTPVLNAVEKKWVIPLCKKCKIKINIKNSKRIRGFSILITMIIVIAVLYGFFAMVIPHLIRSIQSITFQFPFYINNLTVWITKLLADNPDIEKIVMDLFDQYSEEINNYLNHNLIPQMNELLKSLSLSFLGFIMQLWNLIIGFVISIYILGSKELFAGQAKKISYALFDTKTANALIADVRFTHRTFSGYIVGKIIDSVMVGFVCFAGTTLIGAPYAVLISVIVGITNIIPFFGPYLGAIPSALLILMVDPLKCLYFIIFILILQQIDGNILEPKILGDSTGLPGFWVIFSITLFGGIFGILGMIAGVPIFAVIYAAIRSLINQLLLKKKMPVETNDYMDVGSVEDGNFIPYEPEKANTKSGNKKGKNEPGDKPDDKREQK
ncbi:MAG: AI-2E family transporter [Clostridiales bacterium]|nr:AI-2E family transporter [Clostridiales bacterium]